METKTSVAPGDRTGLQPKSHAGPAEDQGRVSNSMTAPWGQLPPEIGHPELQEQWISKGEVWGKGAGAYQAVSSKTKKIKMMKHQKGRKCQAPIPGHSWVGKNSPCTTRRGESASDLLMQSPPRSPAGSLPLTAPRASGFFQVIKRWLLLRISLGKIVLFFSCTACTLSNIFGKFLRACVPSVF